MYHKGIEGFPYFLGLRSLADIATRDDRVCGLGSIGCDKGNAPAIGCPRVGGGSCRTSGYGSTLYVNLSFSHKREMFRIRRPSRPRSGSDANSWITSRL